MVPQLIAQRFDLLFGGNIFFVWVSHRKKYKAEMEGLDEPPFDSDFGQKIYKNVSKKAWGEWVERQKMLLNEYRLQPWTKEAQEFLVEQMNEFFFGSGGELPKEYVAPQH